MEFINKNIFLIMIAVVSGGMLIWPFLRRTAGGPSVNTLAATQMINRSDAIVVDVRSAEDYARGHILGARSIPLADIERRAGEFDKYKTRPVILYCGDGNRAGGAAATLRKKGFDGAHNLAGGYAAWQQAGLPVEK